MTSDMMMKSDDDDEDSTSHQTFHGRFSKSNGSVQMDFPLQVGHCSEMMTTRYELAMDGPGLVYLSCMGSNGLRPCFDWGLSNTFSCPYYAHLQTGQL